MESSSTETSNQKKDPFEELSKEELVKKCRQFLLIAQKAKQTKDVLNEENKSIIKKLEDLESTSQKDIKAMQEMLNVLTQQKLQLVTDNDTISKQKAILNTEIKNIQHELFDARTKMQDLDTENQHYSRQVKRLTDENDQLISHLDALEKRINELNSIGEQQREQLLALEKQNSVREEKQDNNSEKKQDNSEDKPDLDSNIKEENVDRLELSDAEELKTIRNKYEVEFNNMNSIMAEKDKKLENLCEEIDTLRMKNEQVNQLKNFCQIKSNEIESLHAKIDKLNKIIDDLNVEISTKNSKVELLNKNIDDLRNELDVTKKGKDHYNEKFKSYHSKLVKVFTDLKEIKQCKINLLLVIQDYSKYISKWQNDIKLVSEKFNQEIRKRDSKIETYKSDNNDLKLKISKLENELSNTNQEEIALVNNLKLELNERDIKINNLLDEKNKLLAEINIETVRLEERNLTLEKIEKLVLEKSELENKLQSQEEKINSLNNENQAVLSEAVSLKETIKLLEENKELLIKDMNLQIEKYTLLERDNERLTTATAETQENLKQVEETIQFMLQAKQELEKELTGHLNEIISNKNTIETLLQEKQSLIDLNNSKDQKLENVDNISAILQKLQKEQNELEIKIQEEITKNGVLNKENENLLVEKQSLLETVNTNNKKLEDSNKIIIAADNLKQERTHVETELQNEIDRNVLLTKEKSDLLEIININNTELETVKLTIKELEEENKKLITSASEYQNQISELKNTLDDLRDQLKYNSVNNEEFIKNLTKENSELTEKVSFFNTSINKYEKELSSYKIDLSELQNQLSLSKRENVELLKEMNDMNQALKERGETISKQQEYSQDLLRKIQSLEQDGVNQNQKNTKLEEEIADLKTRATKEDLSIQQRDSLLEEKNEKIKGLELEVQQLKESFNNSIGRDSQDGGYCESETMSTSTISRLDEAARLRDLDGSWEERYSKLRTLALKLKGKVKEQNEQLTQERTEKTESQNKLTTITRNLQSIQTEYDKVQDQFELTDKENKKKIKQIENLTNENEKIKQDLVTSFENISKLQSELESLRKDKMGSSTAAKQFANQIQNLKKEVEDSGSKIKDFENKITKLENSVSSKEVEVQNEIKAHNSTKEKLQKIEKELKKNSVLSLEMEDYERSLKDLSQKLEKKNDAISNLEEKHNAQDVTIKALKDQIRIFEEKVLEGEKRCQTLEQQLLESQTKISTVEAALAQKENRIREVMKSFEDYKIKNEEENSELVQTVTHNQKQLEQLQSEKEHLKGVILGLEEKTKELTKTANDREQELTRLQNEFSNYKVRAQSVLRQNQTRDVASDERLNEEVSELKSLNEQLTIQLENISSKLKTITIQCEQIANEKSLALNQSEELEKMLSKEKANNNILLERQQQLITEHRESIRAQKIHTDTLTQCYKQQIAEQEERHIKEITELKATQVHSNILALTKTHEENLDIASMPREDAEGSESVESNTNNQFSKSTILSLDKLLNSDIENSSTPDYEVELIQCRKRLTEFETKVTHLTDLLADTEQDLAKHAQLNQLLKEEIRRHQRSVEREKHAENLEYLKNVVFKFLTLNNGDEKCHLIPVLNTILKLSPEETQKLNAVAKGTDMSVRAWGSYLPLWSGSNNQH